MKTKIFFMMSILIMLMASCAMPKKTAQKVLPILDLEEEGLKPYTETIKNEYKITPAIAKKFQFFAGDSIVLEKEIVSVGASVGPEGKALLKNSEVLDRVVIPIHTPGVCISIDSLGLMKVVFGNNNAENLIFGPSKKDEDGTYVLFTMKSKPDFVDYGKSIYKISHGINVKLYFNPQEIKDYNSTRTEPGRRVN